MRCIAIIIIFFSITIFSSFSSMPVQASGPEPIGTVKTVSGDVSIIRGNIKLSPGRGAPLFGNDIITTGPAGATGIILIDHTVFSLGPGSRLSLDRMVYDPPGNAFSLVARFIKGTFIFISGFIGKESPASIELKTPDGVIAIRGTKLAVKVKERLQ